jgi:hypothetical protein
MLGLNRKQTVAVGLKGQGGLIMRILRRTLMILVMVVLRMRPWAIGKVFGSLEIEGILGIELGANSARGNISIVLGKYKAIYVKPLLYRFVFEIERFESRF